MPQFNFFLLPSLLFQQFLRHNSNFSLSSLSSYFDNVIATIQNFLSPLSFYFGQVGVSTKKDPGFWVGGRGKV